jgi:Fe-Mn family superoxide dismutase
MTHNTTNTDATSAHPTIDRRAALAAMGVAGAGAIFGAGRSASGAVLADRQIGYDPSKGRYTLPPLPYDYDALEPHIDAQTMRLHHDKHHQGYVNGLNDALTKLRDIREGGDASLVQHYSRELAFNGSGHVNHALFWTGMAPEDRGGGGYPEGALSERIERDFGSFSQFAAHFKAASGSVEASGWGWLVFEPMANKLMVLQVEKHQNLFFNGIVPLLGIDVWEHAYYLKYQNRRGDYIDAFMNVVNWPEIARRYEAAASS